MNARASSLQKFIDVFGEEVLIAARQKASRKRKPNNLVGVTNPILRFIANTTYESQNHLYTVQDLNVPSGDYGYFKLAASVLDILKLEIAANPDYKAELEKDLLRPQAGPMLSALNEIIVAAYYKHLGMNVELNSSKQKGKADINLTDLPFASDAKTFPNNRLRMEAIVNESASQLISIAKQIANQGFLVSIFNPDKKMIHQSMKVLASEFEADKELGHYSDTTLSATTIDNSYQAADFNLTFQPNNVNMFFQASWDMGPAIDELKESLLKAVKQAQALSKQAIPWVMVPRDANRNGIEMTALRYAGELHQFRMDNNDIFAIPVYALEFEGTGVNTVFDIFEIGRNTFNINAETFNKFVKELYSRPELYV